MTILLGPSDADHFRVQVGRYGDRWYHDPLPACAIADATDATWPSVSSVKKASGSDWSFVALKRVAQAAARRLLTFDGQDFDEIYDRIKSVNNRGLKQASSRGTNVHLYFERGLRGEKIEATIPGEDGEEYLPAVRAFFNQYQPELIAAEVVAINRDLNGMGYGGTGDAIIRIEGQTLWPDWKSRGEDSKHGAYPEEAAQVGAYAMADYLIVEGDTGPVRMAVPKLDGGLIVSIKPDGCRIYPVDLARAKEHWEALHSWWVARRTEREPIGKPWAPRKAAAKGETSTTTTSSTAPTPASSATSARTPTVAPSETSAPDEERGGTPSGKRKASILARLAELDDLARERVKNAWPAGVPGLKSGHGHAEAELDLIEAALQEATCSSAGSVDAGATTIAPSTAAKESSPAPTREPSTSAAVVTSSPSLSTERRPREGPGPQATAALDEGPLVPPEDVAALQKLAKEASPEARAWMKAVGNQCAAAGYSINLKHGATKRRWAIGTAMLHVARLDLYEEAVRALLGLVTDFEPHGTIGEEFAALTIEQAEQLTDLADHYGDEVLVRFKDDGTLYLIDERAA